MENSTCPEEVVKMDFSLYVGGNELKPDAKIMYQHFLYQ
jgi:hypothetical protein